MMKTNNSNTRPAASGRPPIVVVMGHIDHGKSTLLDFIRHTKVVEGEAGGITQHLGAYEVLIPTPAKGGVGTPTKASGKITFLDTPGHEAFSAIRERGAIIADLAILIVSAEEGVKAQTLEALKAITEAGKPYIVAINKIDRPNANIEKTKQNLAENNILIESYGGQIPSVNISAKTGEGVDELLDLVLLVAELEDLTVPFNSPASGCILEADRDPKVGITATLIVKMGEMKTGDWVVSKNTVTKIKKLENYRGETIKVAPPATPARVYGFAEIPPVGETFQTFSDKKAAETAAETNHLEASLPSGSEASKSTETIIHLLPVIIKADVAGSLDALRQEVKKITIADAAFHIVSEGLGAISENDVKLAAGSVHALIVGFNVKIEKSAADLAERQEIAIVTNNIIYKLSEWLVEQLESKRPKQTVEVAAGEAKLLKLFNQTKGKQVVGGQVLTGEIKRGREVKIMRRDTEIGRGRITNLEQNKEKVDTVPEGKQFGAVVESKWTLATGDTLQTFDLVNQ